MRLAVGLIDPKHAAAVEPYGLEITNNEMTSFSPLYDLVNRDSIAIYTHGQGGKGGDSAERAPDDPWSLLIEPLWRVSLYLEMSA